MTQPHGWMPGVFRELLHLVDPDAWSLGHNFGTTYYARCGAPCLHYPQADPYYSNWPACPDCTLLHHNRPEWTKLLWGYAALEHNTAHAAHNDDDPAFTHIPDHGTPALCGTWLTGPSPDPRRAAGVRACAHCVLVLTEGPP